MSEKKVLVLALFFSIVFNQSFSQNISEWEKRKKELQECISGKLIAANKYSFPESSPVITQKRFYKDYTVENIALETSRGLYVCGSIYRPATANKKNPAVLVPNGHFNGGRYRADIQYICASLARMGAIAISYDLFGWGESRLQVKEEDHYSSVAMKIQKLNTSKILDYLFSLPETDTSLIGITGASGGGSQCMLNSALDSRIKVSVPVVMLSADYPGGCACETGIDIHKCGGGTNNAEIAAMAAPRPQLVISCGKDWTANVPQKEYPYLKKIYSLYGKESAVKNVHLKDEGHDYGFSKRKAMYAFMAEHLKLNIQAVSGKSGNIDESGAVIEDEPLLLVFGDDGKKLPANALRGIHDINNALGETIENKGGNNGIKKKAFSPPLYDVKTEGKKIILLKNNAPLVVVDSVSINFIAQFSNEIIYNGSDSVLIRLNYPLMPDFNRLETGFDHSFDLGISFRDNNFHLTGTGDWVQNITIHMTDRNDHFFGLQETLYPQNKKSPDLRGSVVDVEVNGEQFRYKENFASAFSAFFFNPKGYASFMNTFAKGRYHLAMNGQTTLYHETSDLNWYIFSGGHNEIYSSYYKVIGVPKKVPVWSCGPIIWRDENRNGSAEILDDAHNFAALKIPLTGVMVDRPYSNGSLLWSKMDFSEKFDDPAKWIKTLKDSGLYFMTWVAPATYSDTAFPGILDGSFSYIDLTNPDAIKELAGRLKKNQYDVGVKGHKMDRADEHFPDNESWFDGTPPAERKNKYVYLYAKVIDSILRNNMSDDQLNYARAAIHGSQKYLSGIWGGDPRSTWDGMAGNLANSIRASYMGFPNWGSDVGGYLGQSGKIADELYIRWLQWGAFNGIYEIKIDGPGGVGEDRAPWHCSQQVQDEFRRSCEMRMEWLPHIYSQLNTSATSGVLMKPLGMVYPEDSITYNLWDEYIFGNTLLVAPVLSAENSRMVYLPEGEWIDYYSNEMIKGGGFIKAEAGISRIPLYVRSGSLQARGNIYAGNSKLWSTAAKYVHLYYYPGDDLVAFDFVDEHDKIVRITATAENNKLAVTVPPVSYMGSIKIFTKQKPLSVMFNNKKVKFSYGEDFIVIDRKSTGGTYTIHK